MSKQKYIENTLTLPSELPLFNYNINFDGLRHILEGVNIKTNNNEEEIRRINEILLTKLPTNTLQKSEKKMCNSFLFGNHSQQYINKTEANTADLNNKPQPKDLSDIDYFCYKIGKIAEMVEHLMRVTTHQEQRINSNDKTHEKMIAESFRRLDEKLNSNIDSFTKTINGYFNQSTTDLSEISSGLNILKINTQNKLADFSNQIQRKVSENSLKGHLEGCETKIKKSLESQLKADHAQRLATLGEIKHALKQAEKDLDLKNKVMSNKVQELADKFSKSLLINTFEIEKHKIYEKISELRNRSEDLLRKNSQFVEFRKSYMSNNQKIVQEIIGLNDQIKKLNNKESSFKKMENIGDILTSLNPHMICEIGEEVKLHEKEIGKLQKLISNLQTQLRNKSGEKPMPEVNSGQSSDLIQKIIKQFMSNMDFEGRVKRTQKDVYELKKKNDIFIELEKKIYMLSKQMDMGAINKELKKKCDEENTRRDVKILDSKIDQLFDFYKQIRRQMEQKKKTIKIEQDNASLTTKKLLSANCLSCTPSTPSTRRHFSKNKLEMSLDYGLQNQKNTIYSRIPK